MAFQSYFDSLPFNGSFDNGMPVFPMGGGYYGFQPQTPQAPSQDSSPPLPIQDARGQGTYISGFGPDAMGAGTIPSTQNYGDAQTYGFNFGGYGGSQFGFPNTSGSIGSPTLPDFGNIGGNIGSNIGQKLSDRIDSLTQTPSIDSKNYWQALINAGGLFSPAVGLGAGILQGFNVIQPGETTGNPIADAAFTPGMVQQGTANIANWIDRQFGGQPMQSSYIDPNMAGPPTPNGDPYNGSQGQYIAPPVMGPDYSAPNPAGPTQNDPGWGGAGSLDYIPPPDPFFANGGQVYNMGGADIFNSIGLSPWQTGDMGGGLGYANFGNSGGSYLDTYGPIITSQNNS